MLPLALLRCACDFLVCKFFEYCLCHIAVETPASALKESDAKSPTNLESTEGASSGSMLWKKWQITKGLKDLAKSVISESGGTSLIGNEECEQSGRKENLPKCCSHG